jgi:predicted GIY-YIG superfamily endonuclease
MVYRMLNASAECIYIGFTSSPLNRLQAHLSGKPWAGEVAAIYYSAGMAERRAREVETEDIRIDRPKYNRTVRRENPKHET